MKRILFGLLACILVLAACQAKEGIEVSDAWARTASQGMNSAVYFEIQNHNAEADELTGAAAEVADAVEVHESKMEGDVMKMSRVDSVLLEPSAAVQFEPGGYHVMLIGLKRELNAGDEIQITLQFRNSPALIVTATVQEADGMNSDGMHSP